MSWRRAPSRWIAGAALPLTLILLFALPANAVGAGIVNGDFESGTLQGWHVHRLTSGGNWFAYEGTATPISEKRGRLPVPPPPEGSHAAIADELTADTVILYQDIALPAGSSEKLSLLAYYASYDPIAIPSPDTLSVEEEALGAQRNQQFRIDVMKPEAPLESLDPADILATLFQTRPGDPQNMSPTRFSADLAPFAGQTVRLRVAVAAREELLNAGIDAVSLVGAGSAGSGAGHLRLGKPKADPRSGTVTLPVQVPAAGTVRVASPPSTGGSRARQGGASGKRVAIVAATAKAAGAGTLRVRLRLAGAARALLRHRHRLRVPVSVTFQPRGGGRESAATRVLFKQESHTRH